MRKHSCRYKWWWFIAHLCLQLGGKFIYTWIFETLSNVMSYLGQTKLGQRPSRADMGMRFRKESHLSLKNLDYLFWQAFSLDVGQFSLVRENKVLQHTIVFVRGL